GSRRRPYPPRGGANQYGRDDYHSGDKWPRRRAGYACCRQLNNCLRRRGNAYGSLHGRLLLNSANKPNALANRCADEPLLPSRVENTVFKSIQHFPAHSDRNRPPRCASASLTRVASFENQHHLKEISTPPQSRVDRRLVSSYAFRLTSGEGLKPSDTKGMRD